MHKKQAIRYFRVACFISFSTKDAKKEQLKKLRAAVNSDSKPRKKAYMDKKQQYNYTFKPTFCQVICENKKENRLCRQPVLLRSVK